MNKKHGFTLVEFLIVVTVIGIISGMTTLSFIKVQIDAKDSQRANQVKIVSEALEKYYLKNGEYPSCNTMAGSVASVSSLLGIDQNVLKSPTAASGTNSIIAACGDLSVGVDSFAYRGVPACIASPSIACTAYTLKYRGEANSSVISMNSRHGSMNLTLTSIGAISGSTTAVGNTLSVGSLDPIDATASYQWQSATTAGGTYTNIGGATGGTYVLTLYELGKYLKVVATGNSPYTGTAASAATAQVTDTNWITIGTQTWGKYNLNVGTKIQTTSEQTDNANVEKYCYDNWDPNCATYGALYEWNEAMQYSTAESAQGICTAGSHIPSDNEWKTLEIYLGMTQPQADATGLRGTDQGTKLKTGGSSGFNALMAGKRAQGNAYSFELGTWGYVWTSTAADATTAWSRHFYFDYATVVRWNDEKNNHGYSVRCVINTQTALTSIAAISGSTTAVGNVLTAGTITPGAATVAYQWQNATTAGGTYTNIAGATSSTYTLKASDVGKYIKVVATGTGMYTGTVTSAASTQVSDASWIAVGVQVWAKTNLNVGTMIAGTSNQTNNAVLEKYCYSNSETNCTSYGGLYQWNEMMQYITTEGSQGICPAGSHVPSDNDWKILEIQLGMAPATADLSNWRGTDQGTQMKSGGAGLNMPLTGMRDTDTSFTSIGSMGTYWSSSPTSYWDRWLAVSRSDVMRSVDNSNRGEAVRCVGN